MNWDDLIVDAAATDTGMRRSNNQDCMAIVRATNADIFKARGHLYMVADGMGAHAVGEMASKLACDYIPHTYLKTKNGTPADALSKAYHDVGAQIYNKAAANPDFHRMGTTCSTLVLLPTGAFVAHVGDSRVYRVRSGRIDQLSCDHSLVWELIRKGHMQPDQVHKAYPRNVITRSLGPEPSVEVDLEGPHQVEQGDVYVLCSDGLSGPVSDHEIGAFASHFHPDDACRYLIQLANLRGGPDNITVLIVRIGPWVEPGSEPASDGNGSNRSKPKGKFLTGLLGSLKGKSLSDSETVHEPYHSDDSQLDSKLVATMADVVKHGQSVAIEQTWTLDWPELTRERKRAEELFKSGDLRRSLKHLGEAIVLLGLAGRLHRKESRQHDRD